MLNAGERPETMGTMGDHAATAAIYYILYMAKIMWTPVRPTSHSKTRHKGRKAFGHFHFFYGLQQGVKMHIVPLAIPVFV